MHVCVVYKSILEIHFKINNHKDFKNKLWGFLMEIAQEIFDFTDEERS